MNIQMSQIQHDVNKTSLVTSIKGLSMKRLDVDAPVKLKLLALIVFQVKVMLLLSNVASRHKNSTNLRQA